LGSRGKYPTRGIAANVGKPDHGVACSRRYRATASQKLPAAEAAETGTRRGVVGTQLPGRMPEWEVYAHPV